jgi:hypothetical protein
MCEHSKNCYRLVEGSYNKQKGDAHHHDENIVKCQLCLVGVHYIVVKIHLKMSQTDTLR